MIFRNCALLFAIVLHVEVFAESQAPVKRPAKWQVATYQGLTLGKSKRADVERTFGQPTWSGHPEDPSDNPVESLLSYEYQDVGGFDGKTAVIMNRKSGVLTEIILYFDYQRPVTKAEILAKYGSDFIERDDFALGPCPTVAEQKRYRKPEKPEGVFLVYPSKGMYVHIDYQHKAQELVFLTKCP